MIETERLIMRPWREDDAETLFRYAQDPAVGPAAGWPPHKSVEESLEIIRTVFSQPEVYAMVLKSTGQPIGSCGIMFSDTLHSVEIDKGDAEIGYWVGFPHWGFGYATEVVRALAGRCFSELGLSRLWIGHYDGNERSRRVAEKCGFRYHHTEHGKTSLLGDIRTEHFLTLTAEEFMQK